jgi:hypothetical protein
MVGRFAGNIASRVVKSRQSRSACNTSPRVADGFEGLAEETLVVGDIRGQQGFKSESSLHRVGREGG